MKFVLMVWATASFAHVSRFSFKAANTVQEKVKTCWEKLSIKEYERERGAQPRKNIRSLYGEKVVVVWRETIVQCDAITWENFYQTKHMRGRDTTNKIQFQAYMVRKVVVFWWKLVEQCNAIAGTFRKHLGLLDVKLRAIQWLRKGAVNKKEFV